MQETGCRLCCRTPPAAQAPQKAKRSCPGREPTLRPSEAWGWWLRPPSVPQKTTTKLSDAKSSRASTTPGGQTHRPEELWPVTHPAMQGTEVGWGHAAYLGRINFKSPPSLKKRMVLPDRTGWAKSICQPLEVCTTANTHIQVPELCPHTYLITWV